MARFSLKVEFEAPTGLVVEDAIAHVKAAIQAEVGYTHFKDTFAYVDRDSVEVRCVTQLGGDYDGNV